MYDKALWYSLLEVTEVRNSIIDNRLYVEKYLCRSRYLSSVKHILFVTFYELLKLPPK